MRTEAVSVIVFVAVKRAIGVQRDAPLAHWTIGLAANRGDSHFLPRAAALDDSDEAGTCKGAFFTAGSRIG